MSRTLRYLRIAFSITCLAMCIPIGMWSVQDFRKIGMVALVPYALPILWCITLAVLPWAKAVGRFSLPILPVAGRAAMRNYLRLGVSTGCLVVSLLMMWLWMHSYNWNNTLQGVIGTQRLQFTSEHGVLSAYIFPEGNSLNFPDRSWIYQRFEGPEDPLVSWRFWIMRPSGTNLVAPHWFPVAIFGLLSAVPWLGFLRFSLRTLLIGMTVVAVVIGLVSALNRWPK